MDYNIPKSVYKRRADKAVPPSSIWINMLKAFVVGGLICVIGQCISDILKFFVGDKDAVAAFTSVILVFLSAFFTAISLYDNLGKFAGAGALLPITGFANSMVAPALEYKSEGPVMGIGAKMFIIAGPVIVYGVSASWLYGIIYYICTICGLC